MTPREFHNRLPWTDTKLGFEGSDWQGTWPGFVGLTAFLLIPEDRVQQQGGPQDRACPPRGPTGKRVRRLKEGTAETFIATWPLLSCLCCQESEPPGPTCWGPGPQDRWPGTSQGARPQHR